MKMNNRTKTLYTKTSLPYTSLPLHFATVTKIFRFFSPKNRGFVTIFPKISNFQKILRSNFIATIDTGTSGISRISLEIPEISKLQFFGKFSVLLYYISLLRQSASLPLHFATVRGLTAQKCNGSEVLV